MKKKELPWDVIGKPWKHKMQCPVCHITQNCKTQRFDTEKEGVVGMETIADKCLHVWRSYTQII